MTLDAEGIVLVNLARAFKVAGWSEKGARDEALRVALERDLTDATTDDLVEIVVDRHNERQAREKASSGVYGMF